MTLSSILSADNLSKVYTEGLQKTFVISSLSLTIRKGEFVVIMGSSGSGKSTLLYMLGGLDKITDGEIWLEGHAIHQKTEKQLALLRRKEIGFVFQEPNLVPNLTVLENVLIAAYLKGESRKIAREKTHSLLAQVEMDNLADRLPSQLSGGQQQRTAIIRALINSPHILMADEPTGNLNSATSEAVMDVFTRFHRQNQTILMVTHDVKSACRGERILYLRDGNITGEFCFEKNRTQQKKEVELAHWLSQKGW